MISDLRKVTLWRASVAGAIVFSVLISFGCTAGSSFDGVTGESKKSPPKDEDQRPEKSTMVTGAFLTCGHRRAPEDPSRTSIGCTAQTPTGPVDPNTQPIDWQIIDETGIPVSSIVGPDPDGTWQTAIEFSRSAAATATVRANINAGGGVESATKRVADIAVVPMELRLVEPTPTDSLTLPDNIGSSNRRLAAVEGPGRLHIDLGKKTAELKLEDESTALMRFELINSDAAESTSI